MTIEEIKAKPFRVLRVYRCAAPGMHGWASSHTMHATKEEALTKAEEVSKIRGTKRVIVEFAVTSEKRILRWEKV